MKKSRKSKSTVSPPALPTKSVAENLTEASAKAALIESRGDIFIAAQLLNVTAMRLHRAIQVSALLQAALDVSKESGSVVPLETIHRSIEARTAIYRAVGLDALHDLATMPIDANSAQNQVKLAAAARLAGSVEAGAGGSELAETLRELNKSYQENAPRLRVIRERTTIETVPAEREVKPSGAPE